MCIRDSVRAVSPHIGIMIDHKGPEVRTTGVKEPIHYNVGDVVDRFLHTCLLYTSDANNLTEASLKKYTAAQGELANAFSKLMVVAEKYPEMCIRDSCLVSSSKISSTLVMLKLPQRQRFFAFQLLRRRNGCTY